METKKEELTFNIYAKEAEAAVLGSLMTFEDALAFDPDSGDVL